METSINQRLKKEVDDKKISSQELYKKIGVSKGVWSGWINAGRAIPLDKLVKILILLPDIDARWLLTGETSAPAKPKPYKNETQLDVANDGGKCCQRCKDLEKQIALQDELLDHYRAKKETGLENSAQVGQYAKRNKTAGN